MRVVSRRRASPPGGWGGPPAVGRDSGPDGRGVAHSLGSTCRMSRIRCRVTRAESGRLACCSWITHITPARHAGQQSSRLQHTHHSTHTQSHHCASPLLQARKIHSRHAAGPHCIAPCMPETHAARPLTIPIRMLRHRSVGPTWLAQAPCRSGPLTGQHLTTVHCMQSCPIWRDTRRTAACAWTLPQPSPTQLAHMLARQRTTAHQRSSPRQRTPRQRAPRQRAPRQRIPRQRSKHTHRTGAP